MAHQKFLAPAKVNLCLHVNGKRADGYHELTMVMQSVSLYDELEFAVIDEPVVRFHCEADLGASKSNLVVRAARAMLAYDDQSRGVDVVLHKHIPVAAGLGGGSSDAATTILALNQLLDLQLEENVLHKEALSLGADVPFFLYQPLAWASGVGDQFTSIKIEPSFWIVLVNPGVAVSTAKVYGSLNCEDYSSRSMVPRISSQKELVELLYNDLERAAMTISPTIAQIKSIFVELEADGTLMSGSGATVFGLFFDKDRAQQAASVFVEEYGYWSQVVAPLSER